MLNPLMSSILISSQRKGESKGQSSSRFSQPEIAQLKAHIIK